MSTPKLEKVESSQIAAIGYSPETRTLAIQFKNGGTYTYDDFPAKAYADFKGTESIGKHFHAHIRGRFKHQKL